MSTQIGRQFTSARSVRALVAAVVFSPVLVIAQTSTSSAPPQLPAWQVAAGGKMEFEAATIKPSQPDARPHANIGLNIDNEALPPNGLLSASDMPLPIYIEFAYKMMLTREQVAAMVAHLPKWVAEQGFDIEARADGSPSKDQMRLMMQSLLADRFKLAVHFETAEAPVFAMVLDKPGKTGPRLRPHAQGPACDAKLEMPPDRSSPKVPPGGFLSACRFVGMIQGPNHTLLLGARDVDMPHIASYLPTIENEGRPVVDQTGLTGKFDFSINWSHTPQRATASTEESQPDDAGPTFEEALRDQLGIRLKPARAPVQTLVIDHVEEPTPN